MMRPSESLTDLLARREVGLLWLTTLSAALLLTIASILPMSLPWSAGAVALAGAAWAVASLWIVALTRVEGEPPDLGVPLLVLVALVAGGAAGGAGWGLATSGENSAAVLGWGAAAAGVLGLLRRRGATLEADPGRRIERLWRLHNLAGRLLAVGGLAALLGPGTAGAGGLAAALGVVVALAVVVAGVAAWMVPIAAELDQARLVVLDLPPQPATSRGPGWLAGLGAVAFVGSGLWSAPWPGAEEMKARLSDAGWVAPEDGRARWMVVDDVELRGLTLGGPIQARFGPDGEHLVATAGGINPAFWLLWSGMSWYPQQVRDLWDITELDISPDGAALAVGRRRGLVQIREFPSGKETSSALLLNAWAPLPTAAPGGRLHYAGQTLLRLGADLRTLESWSAEEGAWLPYWRSEVHPIQGFQPSPDGRWIALLSDSWRIEIVDTWETAAPQVLTGRGTRRMLWTADASALLLVGQGVERVRLADGARTRLFAAPASDADLDDQGRLAVASYGVTVLDAETGAVLLPERRPGRGGAATTVSWGQGGEALAVGTHGGDLEIWSVSEHRLSEAVVRATAAVGGMR